MSHLRLLGLTFLLLCGIGALAASLPSNTVVLQGARDGAAARAQIAEHRQRVHQQARLIERYRSLLVRKRVWKSRLTVPRLDTFYVEDVSGRARTRAAITGSGTLTFAYSGWSAGDTQLLSAYLTRAYPVLVSLYGKPAADTPVTIEAAGVMDTVEGGEVVIDAATGAVTIRVEPLPADFSSGDNSHYGNNLLQLVLHAFHAPALLGFDAWEEGMARAAALVASLQLDPSYDLTLDGGYMLPLYESLNQPALAAVSFFPPTGIDQLAIYRLGMAMSAWLKVYTEKPTAFADFNTSYYAAVAVTPTIAGSLAGLRGLMQTAVPMVEDQAFATWYDQQQVLRSTTIIGNRLFVAQSPQQEYALITVIEFSTGPDGSDLPLSGTAQMEYLTYDLNPVYPQEGNTVTIPADPSMPGIGMISPSFYNIGETATQRLRINVSANGMVSTVYFPYMIAGNAVDTQENITDENEFFGVVIGGDTGTVFLALPGASLQTTLVQGAFGINQTSNPAGLTYFARAMFTVTVNGTPVNLWRNVGPWFYSPVLVVGADSTASLAHTFSAGLALVSFPITPMQTDAGVLFGFPVGSTNFQFASYDPTVSATDPYRKYPNTPPIQPGAGFWMNLPTALTATIAGVQPSADDPRALTLVPGWNLIGNTYNGDVNPWAMNVTAGSSTYVLQAAMQQGIIGPVWTYNPAGFYEVNNTWSAWQGGWIANLTANNIILAQAGANRAKRAQQSVMQTLTGSGWGMALHAHTGTSQDNTTILGVAGTPGARGTAWLKPPAAGKGVRVAFIHPKYRLAGAAYATDIRDGIGALGETWEFDVTSYETGPVTLNWPDMRQVPQQYQATLVDLTQNTRQYLRTTSAYQYQAHGSATQADTRHFNLIIDKAPAHAPVNILQCQFIPTRGPGGSVQLILSASADVLLEVRTPTGKLIHAFTIPASRANEPIVITWDGRGAGGKLVPSGAYLINLTARTADGFTIRRGMGMMLRR